MKLQTYQFDVLCIGSGVSGLMASISASKLNRKVCILSKEPLSWGNTRISGGIIAKSEKGLREDMLKSGSYLNQEELIDVLLSESNDIHDVIESWGHLYLRETEDFNNKLEIKPGGHSIARTYISSYQGISLSNILRFKLLDSEVEVLEETIVCQLLVKNKKAYGVLAFNWVKGEWMIIYSKKIILASGGAGMLYYPHTDNMRSATGDGYALALHAGAHLIDMEQVQFIPFGVASTEGITGLEIGDTSAAGPYGVLRNDEGELILDQLTEKTRETVSQKIALEIKKGKPSPNGGVWLDPTENTHHSEGETAWENVKNVGSLDAVRFAYGSECYRWKKPFEVIPTQHYIMGGIQIDHKGNTNIENLLAVGEVVGGIHGAGRLGSMSLFDGLVFGRVVGKEAASSISDNFQTMQKKDREKTVSVFKKSISQRKWSHSPFKLKKELAKIMWEHAGVIRDEKGLKRANDLLQDIENKSYELNIDWDLKSFNQIILNAIELKFMITTAQSIIASAILRKESIGSHYRIDYLHLIKENMYRTTTNYEGNQLITRKKRSLYEEDSFNS